MKIDCEALAEKAARFGGLRDSQIAGLAVLFRLVEREAFCDGVRSGRTGSYAKDPSEMYEREYASQAAKAALGKATVKTRRRRQAFASAVVGPNGEHRIDAAPDASIETLEVGATVAAVDPHDGNSSD